MEVWRGRTVKKDVVSHRGPGSKQFALSRLEARGLELLSKRNRDMREIKDRNTEQHWEGNSMNTECASFIFHMLIIHFTPEGERECSRLH